jgi:threonine dehydrogenase-like Zn-dependent dehydrogenase
MTVRPGTAGSAAVTDLDAVPGVGEVLVDGLAVGICGTDRDIAAGHYGEAPPGHGDLVIGHESVGRVRDAPAGSGLQRGDLVVGIVRRPDPVPCPACAIGAWDMCRNGRYTERGIKQLDGYGAEQWRIEASFAVPVARELGDLAVLVEPASVIAKAWDHTVRIAARGPITPRRALITGAGPIGLLAALAAFQRDLEVHVLDRVTDGPKPQLVADLGATYHCGDVIDVPEPDVVLECTGASSLVADVLRHTGRCGIVCLTGVSTGGRTVPVDVGAINRELVLDNDVVFGSVNANRRHYEAACDILAAADRRWIGQLITRRVPLDQWIDGLEPRPDDIKVVVQLATSRSAQTRRSTVERAR